jgi:hypothetical protein
MISSRNRRSLLYSRISPSSSGVSDASREALAAASSPGAPLPAITPTTDAPAIAAFSRCVPGVEEFVQTAARVFGWKIRRVSKPSDTATAKVVTANKQQIQKLKQVVISMADTARFREVNSREKIRSKDFNCGAGLEHGQVERQDSYIGGSSAFDSSP